MHGLINWRHLVNVLVECQRSDHMKNCCALKLVEKLLPARAYITRVLQTKFVDFITIFVFRYYSILRNLCYYRQYTLNHLNYFCTQFHCVHLKC